MVRLDAVLDSWKSIRADAAQAVEDFPPDELDFRPIADLMTFREVARHILDAGNALAGLLVDGEEKMTGSDFREKIKKYYSTLPADAGAIDLAREMRDALDAATSKLATQSQEFYAGMITRFDGQQVTRMEMLQWTKEHELTHRSQLFMYLRLKGIVPPTTRRRMAKK